MRDSRVPHHLTLTLTLTLKIRINILGSVKLERAFRAFVCATGDLCRPFRAELVPGLWQAVLIISNLPLVGGREEICGEKISSFPFLGGRLAGSLLLHRWVLAFGLAACQPCRILQLAEEISAVFRNFLVKFHAQNKNTSLMGSAACCIQRGRWCVGR